MINLFIISIVLAYIIGSIPSALWVGKASRGIDVREHGSMNAGATNTFRVLGKRSGMVVLLLDIFKGFTATNLVHLFPAGNLFGDIMEMKVLLGMLAVLGHIYPIMAGFKGGKGIATLLGMVLALNPLIALGVVAVFLIAMSITHMVSVGSIIGTMSFAIFSWMIYGYRQPVLILLGILATLLVLFTHRKNVKRIIKGEEKKIFFSKSRQEEEEEEHEEVLKKAHRTK